MKIILREDVDNLGRRGDVVNVAAGYGRNFLLPKGKAYAFTQGNARKVESERHLLRIREAREKEEAEGLAQKLSQISTTIVRKVGENETLYGSVTGSDVAEALEKEGFEIDKRRILLEEPIKSVGIYTVPVRLHPEVTAEVKVWVVKE
ncbi:MAG TPA: 50S ribosomal protein L9 [Candidatus Saccharimonadales bacterium]|nr:50S ribosomal protein L9 [Candidatus Saccharimonadales bacterium]